MAALADLLMVEVRYRKLSEGEQAVVTDLLVYASAKLRVRVPSIDARVAAGTLDPALPEGAVVDAVVRVLRNRDTATRAALSQFDGDGPPGPAEWTSSIGFLDGEIRDLMPGVLRSVGSTRITSSLGYPSASSDWWPG